MQGNLFHGQNAYGDITPREIGEQQAQQCAAAAERKGWSKEDATAFVLDYLGAHWATLGETVVAAAMVAYPAHTAKAYGVVFSGLSRAGKIRCVGHERRANGHGAPGPVWELVG